MVDAVICEPRRTPVGGLGGGLRADLGAVLTSPPLHGPHRRRRGNAAANLMMDDIEQPGIGKHLAPGSPLALAGQARQPAEPAPQLGEHTDTVLSDLLDLSSTKLAQLHEQAVVGSPS